MKRLNEKLQVLDEQIKELIQQDGDNKFVSTLQNVSEILNEIVIGKQREEHKLFMDEMQQYLFQRLDEIKQGYNPLKLSYGSNVAIQIVPRNAFENDQCHSISDLKEPDQFNLYPIYSQGFNDTVNVDGIVKYVNYNGIGAGYGAYTKVYTNGIIEAVSNGFVREESEDKIIPSVYFEKHLLENTQKYVNYLKELGVNCPLYIMVSLQRINGYKMSIDRSRYFDYPQPITSNDVNSKIVTLNSYDENIDETLHPILDQFWNASGWDQSPYYNHEGRWQYNR